MIFAAVVSPWLRLPTLGEVDPFLLSLLTFSFPIGSGLWAALAGWCIGSRRVSFLGVALTALGVARVILYAVWAYDYQFLWFWFYGVVAAVPASDVASRLLPPGPAADPRSRPEAGRAVGGLRGRGRPRRVHS